MQKGTVEKIVIKDVYITYDGYDFEDYGDAVFHEFAALSAIDEIKCFDHKGERTTFLDRTDVVYLDTPRATQTFLDLHNYESYTHNGLCDASLGWYFWDGDKDMWVDPYESLEEAKREINKRLEKCGGPPIE